MLEIEGEGGISYISSFVQFLSFFASAFHLNNKQTDNIRQGESTSSESSCHTGIEATCMSAINCSVSSLSAAVFFSFLKT